MIILDTNILSELMRSEPSPQVISWLDSLSTADIATTAITVAELRYGAARLPSGRRKAALMVAIQSMLREDLDGRIEPFDASAATDYASIVTEREASGRPIAMADAQIAAICRSLGAELATRNVKDFVGTGIDVTNPWEHR